MSHDLVMRHQIFILKLTLSEFQYFVCHFRYCLKVVLLLLIFSQPFLKSVSEF